MSRPIFQPMTHPIMSASMKEYRPDDEDVNDVFKMIQGAFPSLYNALDMNTELLKGIMTCPQPILPDIANIRMPAGYEIVSVQKAQDSTPQASNQDLEYLYTYIGLPHPMDYQKAKTLKDISPHHSSCIAAKLNAAVGLGFVSAGTEAEKKKVSVTDTPDDVANEIRNLLMGESYIRTKVDEVLDPLTLNGFDRELFPWTEDYHDGGQGYLEIVRDKEGNQIEGINWLPVEDLWVYQVRDEASQRSWRFYRYAGTTSMYGFQRYFAPFGRENRQRVIDMFYDGNNAVYSEKVSEIIPLTRYSNRSRFYGYPEWLSAAPVIDLLRRALQYKSDWYTNRGVLDYIFTVHGQIPTDEWKKVVTYLQSSVGGGNNFKALALKMSQESTSEVHKLAGNNTKEDAFAKDLDTFAQSIVSAHRVPPVMANILIPGKLGASNEMVQALVSFQLLNCGPSQRNIQATLARTLAGPEGVPGLTPEDFRLNTITSQFDITGMDTVSRSRSEAIDNSTGPEKDRDFSEGVKD